MKGQSGGLRDMNRPDGIIVSATDQPASEDERVSRKPPRAISEDECAALEARVRQLIAPRALEVCRGLCNQPALVSDR